MPFDWAFGANNTFAPNIGPGALTVTVRRLPRWPALLSPETILVSDHTLAGFAGKMKFQLSSEELIAVAAYAAQGQATAEPAK
jgi:hypothetical protein